MLTCRTRTPGLAALLFVVVAAAGVAACGDDDDAPTGVDAGTDMTMPPPVDGGGIDASEDAGGPDVDAGPSGLEGGGCNYESAHGAEADTRGRTSYVLGVCWIAQRLVLRENVAGALRSMP